MPNTIRLPFIYPIEFRNDSTEKQRDGFTLGCGGPDAHPGHGSGGLFGR